MLTRCIFWSFVAFGLLLPVTVRAEVIGTIVEIEGDVTVTHEGKTRAAQVKDEIGMRDTVATGPGARAFILLIDDTEWTLSEKARFEVTEYIFNPGNAEDNKARYSVLEGAFRYVSGLVAKKPQPDVTISTPIGSIGIRGTDFWGGPESTGEYGVYVDEGAVDVKTFGGNALLKRGEGTTVRGREFAPAKPQGWRKERIEKMRQSVFLKRGGELPDRRLQLRARQNELREKLKEAWQKRKAAPPEQRQERMQEFKDRMQQKQGARQEDAQERRARQQERMQQLRQNMQEKRKARRLKKTAE